MTRRRMWQTREIETLRALWPFLTGSELAPIVGHPAGSVYRMAAKIRAGKKHPEYVERMRALAFRQATNNQAMLEHRFSKGHVPATKGKPMPDSVRAKVARTMFKKGHRPATWRPLGSLRINADGYLDRKVRDTGYPPRDWVGVHRLVWEAKHGPVPPGYRVTFRNGARTTVEHEITAGRLECVSAAELMRRNTRHNLPKLLNDAIAMRSALVRAINRRQRQEESA